MLRSFFTLVMDALLPPRASDRRVRSLALEDLHMLEQDGALPYHEAATTALVWELKYYANPHAAALAGAYVAEQLLAAAADELGQPLLIPVPMHRSRRRERGHNQTELLCQAALIHLNEAYEYMPNALERTVATTPQQGLERSRRLKNVHGSMRAPDPGHIKGRVCVVVDDVSTTGATLAEAARALKEAGARRVHTIALARS